MRISSMDSKGTLQNPVLTTAGFGMTESYADVDGVQDMWGELRQRSMMRTLDSGETVFNTKYQWTVRTHVALEDKLLRKSRWIIDGRTFFIDGYEEVGYYYKFMLTEKL